MNVVQFPSADPPPRPDKDAMRSALRAMSAPDDVIELRAFFKGRKGVSAGYFDDEHREVLIGEAARLNSVGAAVYVTLNSIDPQLLGRYCNRVEDSAKATATDRDVIRRRLMLIDLDPVRPADTSATDAQLEAVKECARICYQQLKAEGWPRPMVCESGNGMHLLYPLDLPNDAESTALVKGALAGLAQRFDTAAVKVDQAVFNAGRIVKLYGTVANKGDHTEHAPWRLSRLVSGTDLDAVVTPDQLRALHPKAAAAPSPARVASRVGYDFDLNAFLARLGIAYDQDVHNGAARFKLAHCPFNPEHGQGEAAIFWQPDGRLGFKCQHSSCADKHWQDVRELVDGPREARTSASQEDVQPARDEPSPDTGAAPTDDSASPEWPQTMAPDAYHGIAGEIVRAIEPHTESDPAGMLVQILTSFGLLIGRTAYYQVEGDRHYSNLFVLLNGGTSKGRKGTSWGRVRSIFERVPGWPRVVSGLSSGEGLKWQVRDQQYKLVKGVEELVDNGVSDKRLLVIEPEFGSVLRAVARKGNTLSAAVRSAWDTGTLATLTKNDPITATDTHVSIIGHVTVDELRAELTQTDIANGFINRFLFLCVRRSKCLSRGGKDLPESVVQDLVSRLDRASCLARNVGAMGMTDAGWGIWDRVYPDLSEGSPGLFGAATARGEAQVVRLAMLYALLDEKAQIDTPHLLAALAVWEYAAASAGYVFGSSLGDPVADEILRAVRDAGQVGMTRTQIRDLFKRNCPAARLGAALDLLARRKLVGRRAEETGGRPSEVWKSL